MKLGVSWSFNNLILQQSIFINQSRRPEILSKLYWIFYFENYMIWFKNIVKITKLIHRQWFNGPTLSLSDNKIIQTKKKQFRKFVLHACIWFKEKHHFFSCMFEVFFFLILYNWGLLFSSMVLLKCIASFNF